MPVLKNRGTGLSWSFFIRFAGLNTCWVIRLYNYGDCWRGSLAIPMSLVRSATSMAVNLTTDYAFDGTSLRRKMQ